MATSHVKTKFGSFPIRTACPASAGYKQHENDSPDGAVLILLTKPIQFEGDHSYHIELMVCKNCGSLYGRAADE